MEKIKFKDLSIFLKFAIIGGLFEILWFTALAVLVIIAYISNMMG